MIDLSITYKSNPQPKMQYHILYRSNNQVTYSFSVKAENDDHLARCILARWYLANDTDFLQLVEGMKTTEEIMERLRNPKDTDTVEFIITTSDDYYQYIEQKGGYHIFMPMGWGIPPRDELVPLKNKYSDLIQFWYHPFTTSFWLDTKHSEISNMRIMNDDIIVEHKLREQVAELGV